MRPTAFRCTPARRSVLSLSAAIAALALVGCEGSGTRSAPSRAASSGGFDPGASEWGRRGPRREALPEPQASDELAAASEPNPDPIQEERWVVLVEEEAVAEPETTTQSETGPDEGWIGDDLLGGDEVVAVTEEEAAPPAGEVPPPPPPAREIVAEEPVRTTPDPAATAATAAAGTVVASRPQPEPSPTPVPVTVEEGAMAILRQGARSPDPSIRANAIESLLASPAMLEEVVTVGLVDSNRGVRFVAAMCIGRARLSGLAHLVEPLARDTSPSVRAAAIYALRRCGRPADPSMLAGMLRSDDPEIRSNAFAVLGELGDRSAAPMVREALGKGMRRVNPIRVRIVELQGAETLVRLGSEEDIEAIRAALFAPVEQGELSILACQVLARVGDQSSVPMLERLVMASGNSARPPEIRLAAAQAIAELGARTQIDLVALASNAARSPDPLIRMQAASLLGRLGGAAARSELASMLADPAESVRVTAAGNLMRLAAESANFGGDRPMR